MLASHLGLLIFGNVCRVFSMGILYELSVIFILKLFARVSKNTFFATYKYCFLCVVDVVEGKKILPVSFCFHHRFYIGLYSSKSRDTSRVHASSGQELRAVQLPV